jgi:peptidoglycan hydrolase-like protein with peptidoglycan-binding domain
MGLLVVQRGHCYRTTGATGAPGEQDFATKTAERVKARVNAVGHTVRIINADVSDDQYKGNAFVALHYDSSSSSSARGASVGYQSSEGSAFALAWKRHYARNGWTGGFRGDNYTAALGGYYGVRRAVSVGNRRAFISEAGFHSNPDDARLLAAPAGPDRVAIAIAAALVDLWGIGNAAKCPPPPSTIPPFPGTIEYGDLDPVGARTDNYGVSGWQKQFNRRGYHLDVDGAFGNETNHVVRHWQSAHGLKVDGIAGPVTWHSLLFG